MSDSSWVLPHSTIPRIIYQDIPRSLDKWIFPFRDYLNEYWIASEQETLRAPIRLTEQMSLSVDLAWFETTSAWAAERLPRLDNNTNHTLFIANGFEFEKKNRKATSTNFRKARAQ
jgi:hypothetical protein